MNETESDYGGFERGLKHGRKVSHFLVDVTAHGRENLQHALAIAFSRTVEGQFQASHGRVEADRQLTLFKGPPSSDGIEATTFPEPLDCEAACDFAWKWIEGIHYPEGDDHDGAQVRGWRVFNEQYGIVGGEWDAFAAIRPVWIYLPA